MEVGSGLRELIDKADTPPEIRVPAVSVVAELLTAQGRLRTGLRLDGEAWNGARGASLELPLVYEDLVVRHCLNLIRAGDWDGLGKVLDDYAAREPGRLLYSGGMLHLMRGYSRLRQGRMRESLAEVRLAVEELTIADPLHLLPFAHAVAAYAAAAVGRQPRGRPAFAGLPVFGVPGTENPSPAGGGVLPGGANRGTDRTRARCEGFGAAGGRSAARGPAGR